METDVRKLIKSLNTPIEREMDNLMPHIIDMQNHFNRDVKYTLGQEAVRLMLSMYGHIGVATDFPEQREKELMQACRDFNGVQKIVKLFSDTNLYCKDCEYRTKLYLRMIPIISSIERQAVGWIKSVQANVP